MSPDTHFSAREAFESELVEWLNRQFVRPGASIGLHTPLFQEKWLDSIRILELIAWTERATGRSIPDELIRMDHFRSVATIARIFAGEENLASR
jgi:acyl carrier protein